MAPSAATAVSESPPPAIEHKAPPALLAAGNLGEPGPILDQSTEVDGNKLYRYVYAYNAAGERTSETVYLRTRPSQADQWGPESMLNHGVYTYEFDSQGRPVVKTVKYDNASLKSYRVVADYQSDISGFTRSELDGDQWNPVKGWSYYGDGVLAGLTTYNVAWAGLNGEPYKASQSFSHDGICNGYSIADYYNNSSVLFWGSAVNDSLASVVIKDRDNVMTETRTTEYSYDGTNGRLLLYQSSLQEPQSMWSDKETRTFDQFGRMTSWNEYYFGREMSQPDEPLDNHPRSLITITYASDEVYDIRNSMYAVFGWEGPVKEYKEVYYEHDGAVYTNTTTVDYDTSGKITAVRYVTDEQGYSQEITVNDKGQIVKVASTDGNRVTTTAYDWEMVAELGQEKIVKVSETDWKSDTFVSTYKYSADSPTIWVYNSDRDRDTQKITLLNEGFRMERTNEEGGLVSLLVNTIQHDNVSFVKPDLLTDLRGFSPNPIIVVAQEGRVLTAITGFNFHGLESTPMKYETWLCNVPAANFFTAEKSGGYTWCYNIYGHPAYKLDGENRLLTEYRYNYDGSAEEGITSVQALRAAEAAEGDAGIPAGQAYQRIDYTYNDEGNPQSMTVVDVDSEGEQTSEITVEYEYNPDLNGLETVISAEVGIELNGRQLMLGSGDSFSVYDLQGRAVATGVSSHVFTQGGVYLITTPAGSAKLRVR